MIFIVLFLSVFIHNVIGSSETCMFECLSGCVAPNTAHQHRHTHSDRPISGLLASRYQTSKSLNLPHGIQALYFDAVNIVDELEASELPYTKLLPARRISLLLNGDVIAAGAALSQAQHTQLAAIIQETLHEVAQLGCFAEMDAPVISQGATTSPAFLRRNGYHAVEALDLWATAASATRVVSPTADALAFVPEKVSAWHLHWLPPSAALNASNISLLTAFQEAACSTLHSDVLALHVSIMAGSVSVLQISRVVGSKAAEAMTTCSQTSSVDADVTGASSNSAHYSRRAISSIVRKSSSSTGFHRQMQYELSEDALANLQSCQLVMVQQLTTQSYIDLDETALSLRSTGTGANATRVHSFTRHIDVEKPAEMSTQHLVVFSRPFNTHDRNFGFLMHMRYQKAGCGSLGEQENSIESRTLARLFPGYQSNRYLLSPAVIAEHNDSLPYFSGCYAYSHLPHASFYTVCAKEGGSVTTRLDPMIGFTAWPDRAGYSPNHTAVLPLVPVGMAGQIDFVAATTLISAMCASGLLIYMAIQHLKLKEH